MKEICIRLSMFFSPSKILPSPRYDRLSSPLPYPNPCPSLPNSSLLPTTTLYHLPFPIPNLAPPSPNLSFSPQQPSTISLSLLFLSLPQPLPLPTLPSSLPQYIRITLTDLIRVRVDLRLRRWSLWTNERRISGSDNQQKST